MSFATRSGCSRTGVATETDIRARWSGQMPRAVVEICRRLDGIPLALELAAARVNVLSVQEIAERLGDRFRLLTGGRRTAVPRQQTLQALIDWSWDLLDKSDQRLLRRLSVFAGGWTLDAAPPSTAPSAADETPRTPGREGTSTPSTASAASSTGPSWSPSSGQATRYRMLETIRQYARDRLVRSAEVDQSRPPTSACSAITDASGPGLDGPDMIQWLARLDAESDNLRAALDWAFEADPRAALELCVSLADYWSTRSIGSESLDWLARAVEVARIIAQEPASPSSRERSILAARALAAAAVTRSLWGPGKPRLDWAEEALAVARGTGDPRALSAALVSVALASVFAGRDWSPIELLKELVPLLEELGEWWQIALMEGGMAMGVIAWDPGQAMPAWRERPRPRAAPRTRARSR